MKKCYICKYWHSKERSAKIIIAETLYYGDNPNKKLADENMICQKAKGRSIQHFRLCEYYNPITLINSIQANP